MNDTIKIHNINFEEFIDLIDKCKSNVYLETKYGDCINLKSKLCQLVGLYTLLDSARVIEATLRCEDKEDESMLFRYNLYHHK